MPTCAIQSQHIVVPPRRTRPHVFFFEPLAQILRGYKARFAVRQVAPCFLAELHKRGVCQPTTCAAPSTKNFVSIVSACRRRNPVPHVREAALIRLPSQFGSHFECADELAHRAGILQVLGVCHAAPLEPFLSYQH